MKNHLEYGGAALARARVLPLCMALALAVGSSATWTTAAHAVTGPADRPHGGQQWQAPSPATAADPRAAAFAAVLARRPPDRPAGVTAVSNCNDAGAGSLREAVGNAVSGDTIDVSNLPCSTITLTSGAIATGLDDLEIKGNGPLDPTIDAGYQSPNFVHLGSGTLTLTDLTVSSGAKYSTGSDPAPGGCIYSQGTVLLDGTTAKYCRARANGSGTAKGGAIYSIQGVTLLSSTISDSSAYSVANSSTGGGVFTSGPLVTKYTTLKNNSARAGSIGDYGYGGAAWTRGDASILYTTVSGNAAGAVAGLDLLATTATGDIQIGNSTFASNSSYHSNYGSALYLGRAATISNSTITGNIESNPSDAKYGAGIASSNPVAVTLQSSIVSGNISQQTSGSLPSDSGAEVSLTGANNLVGYSQSTPPADTIVTFDPLLAPLAFNGGRTQTMAPRGGSLVLNAGNNVNNGKYDQRGPGYPRVAGGAVDIGAIESDVIFADGFD